MNSLNDIHPSLLWALNNRGYDQLTEVQAKVLKKEFINPDLLVSAETGSGKTLAYGINIMTSLLGINGIEFIDMFQIGMFGASPKTGIAWIILSLLIVNFLPNTQQFVLNQNTDFLYE